MHFAKGRDRMVVIIPKIGVAIKIAFIHFIMVVRQILSFSLSGDWEYIKKLWDRELEERGGFRNSLFGGIHANWSERKFYRETHNHFVQPTYFSFLGLINIQKCGKMCTVEDGDELMAFWTELRMITKDEVYVDPHHFQNPLNYCMHDTHVRMTDYGNTAVQQVLKVYGDMLAENLHPPHH